MYDDICFHVAQSFTCYPYGPLSLKPSNLGHCRSVHPPYSSVFVTEFNPEYGNTDLLIWLRKRSSPKYGNGHHLNIFFTVISCVNNVAPSVGNVHVPLYYARCQATRNIPVLAMLSIMLVWDITRWRRIF